MTYAIGAAGTGGHVYPALAVAESLLESGVDPQDICFLGGRRIEAEVVPAAGYPFVELELRGLVRGLSVSNLTIPRIVRRAGRKARRLMEERGVRAVLCMGGYVTVPVAMAARKRTPLILHEQNAHAGLANRLAARWADRVMVSFPDTSGLDGEVVGNPVRRALSRFDGAELRPAALAHYDLDDSVPTLGVFGGSLGAGALNQAVQELASAWTGGRLQIVHLAGKIHAESVSTDSDSSLVTRRVVGFEPSMELFYAAADVALTRAGGSLFEVAATATPAVVVPGAFGGGHQADNAAAMERAGAAVVVAESELTTLTPILRDLLADDRRRRTMAAAASRVARPDAAAAVASAMMAMANG